VLVAGEHWKLVSGERNMGTNHCSLEHVGEAFDALRAAGVPRSRIIVVAQLAEARDWLRTAVATGHPLCVSSSCGAGAGAGAGAGEEAGRARSSQLYARKLAELERRCGGILAEGGADYDRTAVNPDTVYRVLTAGLGAGGGGSKERGPVVPAGVPLLFAIYSHGCSHETAEGAHWQRLIAKIPCDVCGVPHDAENAQAPVTPADAVARADPAAVENPMAIADFDHEHISFQTNEWYIHMPHEAPSSCNGATAAAGTREQLYGGIAHEVHPHPYSLLYWQILFKAFYARFAHGATAAAGQQKHPSKDQAPPPIVAIINACRSGGMATFLSREQFDATHGVQNWPLFMMCSSQPVRMPLPPPHPHL
jgi:hypothetical protein